MIAEYIAQNIFYINKSTNESFSEVREKVKPEKSGNLELFDSLSQTGSTTYRICPAKCYILQDFSVYIL